MNNVSTTYPSANIIQLRKMLASLNNDSISDKCLSVVSDLKKIFDYDHEHLLESLSLEGKVRYYEKLLEWINSRLSKIKNI